ncbi:hypothetical protein [Bradyrhizobium cosmicum]|uniref:hypothetical protein n=1 Tax=Bradyrhizobium cosmicum TaxID=1404864 RepID=UPI0028EDD042|nr:hypothetical protein [Bradyrhizobium cosmicum]
MNVQGPDVRTTALKAECLNQFQNCGYTALTFTIWLRFLRWIKLFSLFSPVMLGAVATWNIVGESMPAMAAVCAFLAVLIPPTFQAAKLDASIKQYTSMAGEFTNLRDRFRLISEYSSLKPFDEFESAFNFLLTKLEKARARPLTPPHVCFLLARRQWQAGYYEPDQNHRSGTP